MFIFSLHVSGDYVHIIRRNNCICAKLGICHCVWVTVWCAGCNSTLHTRQYLEAHVLFRHLSGRTEEDFESTVQKLNHFSEITCKTGRKKHAKVYVHLRTGKYSRLSVACLIRLLLVYLTSLLLTLIM